MKNVNEKKKWYQKKLVWIAIVVALASIASQFTALPVQALAPAIISVIEAIGEDDDETMTPEAKIRGHDPYSDDDDTAAETGAGNRVMSPDLPDESEKTGTPFDGSPPVAGVPAFSEPPE